MDSLIQYIWVGVSYLLGNIPFGLWVTGPQGSRDLQAKGSGNIGATNVFRVIGKKAALLTLLGDIGKGALAVWVMTFFSTQEAWLVFSALAVVIGHIYPVFRNFKGGKGVATGFGVLMVLNIWIALLGFIVWVLTVLFWRYSSLGALVAFVLLPVITIGLHPTSPFIVFSFLLSLVIIIRHWSNLQRLMNGKEQRIGN